MQIIFFGTYRAYTRSEFQVPQASRGDRATAAGVLLVEEAGAAISDFHGNPYRLGGPVVLATNSLVHQEMREKALEISKRDPRAPLQFSV